MIWTLQFSFGDNIGSFKHLLIIGRAPTAASRHLAYSSILDHARR
jgi:hypothetical protein